MDYIEIKLKVIHNLGTFESQVMYITNEQYVELLMLSENFWITDTSFKLETENGAVFLPPHIVCNSILVIELLNNGNNK